MARQQDHSGRRTRVFLVDDEPMVRRGLRFLLGGEQDLEVCGEAAGEHEALEGILAQRPDLAIVDLSLREGDGLALIKRLKKLCPKSKALVFSMHDQVDFASIAFAAGACGYIVKEEGTEQVLEAIKVIREGGFYLSERIAAKSPGLRALAGRRNLTRPR